MTLASDGSFAASIAATRARCPASSSRTAGSTCSGRIAPKAGSGSALSRGLSLAGVGAGSVIGCGPY